MTRREGRLVVNGHSERWLRRGFPWVYRDEVVKRSGAVGATAAIYTRRGELLGRGLLDDGWIAARVFRRGDESGPLDRDWLAGVLERALRLRELLFDDGTTAWRLVNGESDGLPGLRVDWWDHYATVVLDSPAVAPLVEGVAQGRGTTARHADDEDRRLAGHGFGDGAQRGVHRGPMLWQRLGGDNRGPSPYPLRVHDRSRDPRTRLPSQGEGELARHLGAHAQ